VTRLKRKNIALHKTRSCAPAHKLVTIQTTDD